MTFACLLALVSLAQVLRRSQIALKDGPTDDLPEEGAEGTSKPEEKPTAKGKATAKAKGRPRGKAKAAAATKCRQNMDDETSMAEVKNPGNEGVLDETSAMPGTDLEVDSKNAEIEADLAKPVEAHPDSGNGEKEEPAKRKRLRRVKTKDVESAGNEEAVEPKKKRKTAVGKNAVPEAAAGEDGASGAPEAKEAAKPIRKRRAAPKVMMARIRRRRRGSASPMESLCPKAKAEFIHGGGQVVGASPGVWGNHQTKGAVSFHS